MNTLPRPPIKESSIEIFNLCTFGFSDEEVKENLLSCAPYVEKDSEQFVALFPDLIHTMEKKLILPNKVTKDQMKKVYTEKFVPKDSPGRKFYDIIKSIPDGGKCPICGERIVKNLDHYMPKSVYTTLIVTPENLIPTCRDCNFDKRAFTILKPEDAPLHPYFDHIDKEVWLSVKLLPNQAVIYYAKCPESWFEVLKKRVENHLILFELDEFYGSKAGQEIADEIWGWREMLNENGKPELMGHLKMRCNSIEKNRLNSWKAALYRGLITQFDDLIKWLT